MRRKLLALMLLPLFALTSCAEDNDDNIVTESVTVSFTQEEIPVVTTAAEKEKKGFGDYTVTTTELTVTTPANTLPSEKLHILGEDYYLDYNTVITVDAEKCSEFTEEDQKNIDILKEWHLYYADVKNCGSRDLSFLSEMKGIDQIRFWDVSGEDFSWLAKFTELRYLEIVSFDGDFAALSDTLETMQLAGAYVFVKDFSLDEAFLFHKRFGDKFTCVYSSDSDYGLVRGEPKDRPYAVASPCVNTYGGKVHLMYHDNKRGKLRDRSDIFSAYLCNPTDGEVTFDSLRIIGADGKSVPFADGSESLSLGVSLPPSEEFFFELTEEMCPELYERNGVFKAVFSCGEWEEDCDFIVVNSDYSGLEALTSEQREAFEKAHSYISERFGCSHYMDEEYAASHTAEEFIAEFTDAMTYDLAKRFASAYIDENGNLKAGGGDRGSHIALVDKCFYVFPDESGLLIIPVTVNFHADFYYKSYLRTCGAHTTETPEGWRVDRFTLWW